VGLGGVKYWLFEGKGIEKGEINLTVGSHDLKIYLRNFILELFKSEFTGIFLCRSFIKKVFVKSENFDSYIIEGIIKRRWIAYYFFHMKFPFRHVI